MNENSANVDRMIRIAYQVVQSGDRAAARRVASQAAAFAPQREEPWLILAAVASPRASVAYIEQALKINPASWRANGGLSWAQARVNAQVVSAVRLTPSPRRAFLVVYFILLGLLISAVGIVGLGGVDWAARPENGSSAQVPLTQATGMSLPVRQVTPAEQVLRLVSATPAPAQTGLPTATAEPSLTAAPTFTAIPTFTSTLVPTHAPAPTAAPSRKPTLAPSATPKRVVSQSGSTYIVQPGDTVSQIAAMFGVEPLALMQANHIANPTLIQAGQTFVIPQPGSGSGSGSKKVIVDISEQRLYAYEGDNQVYSFVISTGANDGTLRGTFSVLDKIPNAYSAPWGFWMPDWLGIYYASATMENGIHSLPVLANGKQLWGESLGLPVTSGCVVLGPADAKLLFDWAVVGTPVVIRS